MNIWLLTVGEPLPVDSGYRRMLRTGLLAKELQTRGHHVRWSTSTFDHTAKIQRAKGDYIYDLSPRYRIELIWGPTYHTNVSVRRGVNHGVVAARWLRHANKERRADSMPDIVVASMPTIELTCAAIWYGKRHGIPVVVDIRDLWPDILENAIPLGRVLAKPLTVPLRFLLSRALHHAAAVTGTSRNFVEWGCHLAGRSPGQWDRAFPLGFEPSDASLDSIGRAGESLRAAGVQPELKVCIFTGAFSSIMDGSSLIEAARILWAMGRRDIQIVMAGKGQCDAKWRSQASGLPNVKFVGWLDAAGLAYLGRVASIGVVAQTADAPPNLPNKVFDYLHAGLPILSNIPGELKELIDTDQCGRTVRASDPEAFARGLEAMLDGPDALVAMSARSTAVASRFSAEAVYGEMATFVEQTSAASKAGSLRPCSVPDVQGRSVLTGQHADSQAIASQGMADFVAGRSHRLRRPRRTSAVSFVDLTERPGSAMSASQIMMARTRYDLARRLTTGGRLLELACGSAYGLDYLRRSGSGILIGLDVEHRNLLNASALYPETMLVRADASRLPFGVGSFSTVLMLEAIYYVSDCLRLLSECARVLAVNGRIVLSLPNRDAHGFHRSPLSIWYPSVTEVRDLLGQSGFGEVKVFGSFPVARARAVERATFRLTGVAQRLHIVPDTLEGRAKIKRVVSGGLLGFEGLHDDRDEYPVPVELISNDNPSQYRVIYASGTRV